MQLNDSSSEGSSSSDEDLDFLFLEAFFSMSLANLSRHPRPFRSTLFLSELKTENSCYFISFLMCLWLSGSKFFSQGKVILYAWPSELSHLGNKVYIHAFTYHQKLAFVLLCLSQFNHKVIQLAKQFQQQIAGCHVCFHSFVHFYFS